MRALSRRIQKWEFEARIFVSLSIVLAVCTLSYSLFDGSSAIAVLSGRLFGLPPGYSRSVGFLLAALLMASASLLRMWAGSILSSDRVMSFRVQNDRLLTRGPYRIVRNPIYLADLIAMCGFALCLPPPGLLLPVLMYLHYLQLVKFEEISLASEFGQVYLEYTHRTPRLLLGPRTVRRVPGCLNEFEITPDGLRHNALYLLFTIGFIVAAFTREFFHAVAIGLPGVYDWAVLHTKKGLPKRSRIRPTHGCQVRQRRKKVFEDILYAQCWEDPNLDRTALKINSGDVVFSITSGGCNTLSFLLDDPATVIALDISPYQNYLLELKIAAFKRLRYDEVLEFVGVRDSSRRQRLYQLLRSDLSDRAREYWDRQETKIREGVIHCGRYEDYMRLLRRWVQRLIGRSTIQELFAARTAAERLETYHNRWENVSWWILTRLLLSRATMTLLFDRAFFRYLDRSFSLGKHFAQRVKYALTELPVRENYFLAYILLGRYYSEAHLPPYLKRENFSAIRERIGRVQIVTDSCEHYFASLPEESISKFNFSNIFEWMSPETYEEILKQTIRVAKEDALLTYRNLLVHRERPQSLAPKIRSLRTLAESLHRKDLSFIYSNYVVEQIGKKGVPCATPLGRYATVGR